MRRTDKRIGDPDAIEERGALEQRVSLVGFDVRNGDRSDTWIIEFRQRVLDYAGTGELGVVVDREQEWRGGKLGSHVSLDDIPLTRVTSHETHTKEFPTDHFCSAIG